MSTRRVEQMQKGTGNMVPVTDLVNIHGKISNYNANARELYLY